VRYRITTTALPPVIFEVEADSSDDAAVQAQRIGANVARIDPLPPPVKPEPVEVLLDYKRPIAIELTAKRYKRWILIGYGLVLLALLVALFGGTPWPWNGFLYALNLWFRLTIAGVLLAVGITILALSRAFAWWDRG